MAKRTLKMLDSVSFLDLLERYLNSFDVERETKRCGKKCPGLNRGEVILG